MTIYSSGETLLSRVRGASKAKFVSVGFVEIMDTQGEQRRGPSGQPNGADRGIERRLIQKNGEPQKEKRTSGDQREPGRRASQTAVPICLGKQREMEARALLGPRVLRSLCGRFCMKKQQKQTKAKKATEQPKTTARLVL